MIKIKTVSASELARYQEQLESLESSMIYPLSGANGFFKINHGKSYGAFFDKIGKTTFFLAFDNEVLVGCVAVIQKKIFDGNNSKEAIYLCDLKVNDKYRARGITRKLHWRVLAWVLKTRLILRTPHAYFVAMSGEKGDYFQKSTSKIDKGLFTKGAELNIYFGETTEIPVGETKVGDEKLLLSTEDQNVSPLKDLDGIKDLIDQKSGKRLGIKHISINERYLRDPLKVINHVTGMNDDESTVCFAIDKKEKELVLALEENGLNPGGTANVYCLKWHKNTLRKKSVWISTNEI